MSLKAHLLQTFNRLASVPHKSVIEAQEASFCVLGDKATVTGVLISPRTIVTYAQACSEGAAISLFNSGLPDPIDLKKANIVHHSNLATIRLPFAMQLTPARVATENPQNLSRIFRLSYHAAEMESGQYFGTDVESGSFIAHNVEAKDMFSGLSTRASVFDLRTGLTTTGGGIFNKQGELLTMSMFGISGNRTSAVSLPDFRRLCLNDKMGL